MEDDITLPASLVSLRRVGAIITVAGKDGKEYRGRITDMEGNIARIRIFEELPLPSESPLAITLLQALPKKERMESIIRKATELGVKEIIPCTSRRSIAIAKGEGMGQDKSHRWPDVARKAVEQCRRRTIPRVFECMDLEQAIAMKAENGGVKLVLYEKEKQVSLKSVLTNVGTADEVTLACGPEGGFAEEEISFARDNGFVAVRLGGRIMRCETAAISALSIIQYSLGDLG